MARKPLARIGDHTVDKVVELEFPAFEVAKFFPTCTGEMLAEARARLAPGLISPDARLLMSFHSLILRTPRATIVVDTCCGNGKERPGREEFTNLSTDYLARLAAAGVTPEEVTHVLCTHLHWDHVGWNTRRQDGQWVPTFPKARYVMARREYEHWDKVHAAGADNANRRGFLDSVLPIIKAERAILVDDTCELEAGITLEPCHGHTPGSVVVNVASRGEQGVFTGDVLHHQIQMLFPELSCWADWDGDLSRKTRRAFMEKHADQGSVVLPAHFPAPTAGRIRREGRAYRWEGLP